MPVYMKSPVLIALCFLVFIGNLDVSFAQKSDADLWLTKGDESVKLERQQIPLSFGKANNAYSSIEIDENEVFQRVEGFGYTLTGGSAQVINSLTTDKKQELLNELFGSGPKDISVSYLRISIGASDLSETA